MPRELSSASNLFYVWQPPVLGGLRHSEGVLFSGTGCLGFLIDQGGFFICVLVRSFDIITLEFFCSLDRSKHCILVVEYSDSWLLSNLSSFIDEGRNPDEYTKQLLNGCVQQNQASKGKVDSFKVSCSHRSIQKAKRYSWPFQRVSRSRVVL